MEILKTLLPLMLTLSLALLVIAAGIASSRGDFASVVARPSLLGRAFLAIVVIPVIAAIAIMSLFPISHAAKAGIFLMAISPVPPLMPGRALKLGGNASYIYGLQGAAALMALLTVPALGSLGARLYDVDAHFPVGVVARNIFLGLVVPLAIGLAIGRWLFPKASPKLPQRVMLVANILLVIVFIPLLINAWPQMVALIGDGTVIAMTVIMLIAMAGGHLLGGPNAADRPTLAIAASLRHPGIALALAGANHAAKPVTASVLLFVMVALVVLTIYQLALRGRQPAPVAQS
ncbi:MAG TPA: Na+-dependent transporter [Novosphingobium sp.]|nr:Na+-dependent transporter [Novosphingobium sp.]